ncbi:MAG: hypothetical protein PVI26_07410 [Chitinispirillia bacterium]|jgi:hypothetical protein
MKRRKFIAYFPFIAAAISCDPRMDKRMARYDEKECPFCTPKPGECSYCDGSTKCTFCNGTGKRKTSTTNYPKRGIERLEYVEECPYCKGSGKCRYCDGAGKCWACKGTSKIDNWDMLK